MTFNIGVSTYFIDSATYKNETLSFDSLTDAETALQGLKTEAENDDNIERSIIIFDKFFHELKTADVLK